MRKTQIIIDIIALVIFAILLAMGKEISPLVPLLWVLIALDAHLNDDTDV